MNAVDMLSAFYLALSVLYQSGHLGGDVKKQRGFAVWKKQNRTSSRASDEQFACSWQSHWIKLDLV
jgi:hypothetical protein